MTRALLVTAAAALIACGEPGQPTDGPNRPDYVYPSLATAAAEFMDACGDACNMRGLSIVVGDAGGPAVAGVCSLERLTVTVAPASPYWSRLYLFHELAHCSARLAHAPQADGVIMAPDPIVYPEQWTAAVSGLMGLIK